MKPFPPNTAAFRRQPPWKRRELTVSDERPRVSFRTNRRIPEVREDARQCVKCGGRPDARLTQSVAETFGLFVQRAAHQLIQPADVVARLLEDRLPSIGGQNER